MTDGNKTADFAPTPGSTQKDVDPAKLPKVDPAARRNSYDAIKSPGKPLDGRQPGEGPNK